MAFDDLSTWGNDARASLYPGEQLLALTSVGVAYGARSGAEPNFWETSLGQVVDRSRQRIGRAVPTEGWVGRAVAGVGGVAFAAPSLDLPADFPESWIGGRTCFGPVGSLARQIEAAVTGEMSFFAVTHQRVLVLTKQGERLIVTWQGPRDLVAAAALRPRLLSRGRFGLVLRDGSWIVLGTFGAHMGSSHAKRVVQALTVPMNGPQRR